jgi:hypothetical protein
VTPAAVDVVALTLVLSCGAVLVLHVFAPRTLTCKEDGAAEGAAIGCGALAACIAGVLVGFGPGMAIGLVVALATAMVVHAVRGRW